LIAQSQRVADFVRNDVARHVADDVVRQGQFLRAR